MTIDLETLPWQAEFLERPEKSVIVIGGVGSGKSIICADWLIERGLMYPKARHYIIGANYPMLKEGTIPTFESRLMEHGFSYKKNETNLSITLTSGPGRGVRFIAWTAKKYQTLKSQMLDSVWCDEAQEWERGWDAYTYIVSRMRLSEEAQAHHPQLKNRLRMSANPPREGPSHWLIEKFVDNLPNDTFLFRVNTYHNHLLPNAEEYIEFLRSTYSAELFRLEVMGEIVDLKGGRVYYNFEKPRHVAAEVKGRKVELDPARELQYINDFGTTPRVSLLAQVHTGLGEGYQSEVVFIIGEITNWAGGTEGNLDAMRQRYPPKGLFRLGVYGDATNTSAATDGQADWDYLRKHIVQSGYHGDFRRNGLSNPPVVDRVYALQSKLRNEKGEIGVVIHPSCTELIADLQKTKWRDDKRAIDHGSPQRGLARSHWSDAVGYFAVAEWPVISNKSRKIGQGWTQR